MLLFFLFLPAYLSLSLYLSQPAIKQVLQQNWRKSFFSHRRLDFTISQNTSSAARGETERVREKSQGERDKGKIGSQCRLLSQIHFVLHTIHNLPLTPAVPRSPTKCPLFPSLLALPTSLCYPLDLFVSPPPPSLEIRQVTVLPHVHLLLRRGN